LLKRCISYEGHPAVWPIPNYYELDKGYLYLKNEVTIYYDSVFEGEIAFLVSWLDTEGVSVSNGGSEALLRIVQTDDRSINDEGYILEVTSDNIEIKANSCKGIFYGIQSFIQIMEYSPDKCIPALKIVDSPFKKIRGVHNYIPARKNIAWFKRYIDFISKYKFNTMYLEIGAGVKYDSHPEINMAWEAFCSEMLVYPGGPEIREDSFLSMQASQGFRKNCAHIEVGGTSYLEKSELQDIIIYAEKRHIEIVPEVQSLSHCYWMMLSHRECAERSKDPYPDTYCPSNPETYKIYFDCLKEVVELIKPKTVHIGHDEYYSVGLCEKCRNRTGHDIFAGDVTKIHDWLAERNIKTVLWSDKFINYTSKRGNPGAGSEKVIYNYKTCRNEVIKATYRAADMVPKDITVMDWYYNLGGVDTGSQDYFYQKNIDVIFGNFDGPWPEMINFTDRIRRPNVLGGSYSVWSDESGYGASLRDVLFHCLDAVNALWYEDYDDRKRYGLNRVIAQIQPMERERMDGTVSYALENDGFTFIDISKHFNTDMTPVIDYSLILKKEKLPYTIPFDICKKNTEDRIMPEYVLAGCGGWSCPVEIPAEVRFRSVAFLHSYTVNLGYEWKCAYTDLDSNFVGYYTVHYKDGTSEAIPVDYRRNIISLDNEFGAHCSVPVYQDRTDTEAVIEGLTSKRIVLKSKPFVIFSYEWVNPYPEKEIKGITIGHNGTKKGGIALFGITGIK
jgi:N-acetyl-beta-hexosaminidase